MYMLEVAHVFQSTVSEFQMKRDFEDSLEIIFI